MLRLLTLQRPSFETNRVAMYVSQVAVIPPRCSACSIAICVGSANLYSDRVIGIRFLGKLEV